VEEMITIENSAQAIEMMLDSLRIRDYATAHTIATNLKILLPDNPRVVFYWGYASVRHMNKYDKASIAIFGEKLAEAVELLSKSDCDDKEKTEIYSELMEKTMFIIDTFSYYFEVYNGGVCEFFRTYVNKYLLKNEFGLSYDKVIELGDKAFELEEKVLHDIEKKIPYIPAVNHNGKQIFGIDKFLMQQAENYVTNYVNFSKAYGMWLRDTNRLPENQFTWECFAEFNENKERYDEYINKP